MRVNVWLEKADAFWVATRGEEHMMEHRKLLELHCSGGRAAITMLSRSTLHFKAVVSKLF